MEKTARYFEYDGYALEHLKNKDKVLGAAIEQIGRIEREINPDLFSALVMQIISQQISTKSAQTVCNRMVEAFGGITPERVVAKETGQIQQLGMSMRKAGYIKEFAESVANGTLVLDVLYDMPDDDLCTHLSQIKGIGVWTAQMLMTFSMQRPDIISYDDLAIHRGLRMLYRHRKITRQLFEKYRRRYSPYASVASLYLWEIAGGKVPGYTDPAAKLRSKK